MPILYSTVARGTTVLAKYADCVGNFAQVTEQILNKIPLKNHKMTYTNGPYLIHYICEDNIIYMCITDNDFDRGRSFGFLSDIMRQFVAEYGLTVATAIAYGMNTEFSQVLALEMQRYSEDSSATIMNQVHGQIQELEGIVVRNIENVMARGERLELLVNKTENLRNSSVSFRQTSHSVARMMFWKNVKMYVILASILLFIVYVIISMACGGLAWQTCIHKQ